MAPQDRAAWAAKGCFVRHFSVFFENKGSPGKLLYIFELILMFQFLLIPALGGFEASVNYPAQSDGWNKSDSLTCNFGGFNDSARIRLVVVVSKPVPDFLIMFDIVVILYSEMRASAL